MARVKTGPRKPRDPSKLSARERCIRAARKTPILPKSAEPKPDVQAKASPKPKTPSQKPAHYRPGPETLQEIRNYRKPKSTKKNFKKVIEVIQLAKRIRGDRQ